MDNSGFPVYNPRMRRIALAFLLLAASAPVSAGKLDLNIYAATPVPRRAAPDYGPFARADHWRPGDPRDIGGESRAVQYLAHAGYAGMAVAGLVGCAATGAVAPAVGFGLVALIHAWQTWQLNRSRDARS